MTLITYLKSKWRTIFFFILLYGYINIYLLLSQPLHQTLEEILYFNGMLILMVILGVLLHYRRVNNRYKKIYDRLQTGDIPVEVKYLEQGDLYQEMLRSLYTVMEQAYEKEKGQLKRAMEEAGDDLVKWTHEIKIPLTVLDLISHELDEEKGEELKKEVLRMEYLVNQVLYMSRANHYMEDLNYQEIGLKQLIYKVLQEERQYLRLYDMEIQMEGMEMTVLSDGKWLAYILRQLIHNATKYSNKGSQIQLVGSKKGSCQELKIIDEGMGIPREDIKRIWDKGFTGQNGRTHGRSTGMGLYLVDRACKLLGHEIEVTSQVGKGTTITLTFDSLQDIYVTKM